MATQNKFDPLKYGATPVNQASTTATFDPTKYGAVAVSTPQKQESLPSKIFRGITEPVVTMLARPVQAAMAVGQQIGDPTGIGGPINADIKLPYYGTIKTPTTKKDVYKDIGRAVQTVSLGIGGGGAGAIAGAAKQGLGSVIKQGAIQGAKIGGAFRAGAGLEETGTAKGAIQGGLYGTAFGAATGGLAPIAGKALGITGKAITGGMKTAGTKLTGITMTQTQKEIGKEFGYLASKPTLYQRIESLITKKSLPTSKIKPVSVADTAVRRVGAGTEKMMGTDAIRVQKQLWDKVIDPTLKSDKKGIDMMNFFEDVKKEVIAKNPEPSRQTQLIKAFDSLVNDFVEKGKMGNVSLRELQDFKVGWSKFLPEKTYQGEPIAAALKEVKDTARQKALQIIYDRMSPEAKTAYMDYGNLTTLSEEAKKTIPNLEKMNITRFAWQTIIDQLLTPITTIAGKVLYKTAQGLEFIGDKGAKTVRDIIGSNFISGK